MRFRVAIKGGSERYYAKACKGKSTNKKRYERLCSLISFYLFDILVLAYFFVMSMIAKITFSTNTARVINELVAKAL